MKARILIIEDNYCKFFVAKQVLESQLNMVVAVVDANSAQELVAKTAQINPSIIVCRPAGGVALLLEKMRQRGTNRRNTEITLILAEDFEDHWGQQVDGFTSRGKKRDAAFASAA